MRQILRRAWKLFSGRPRPAILMYHRVADLPYDPWGLAVTRLRFAGQMEFLKKRRLPLSMGEFVARLEKGRLPRDAVAVTFDDGYIDNLTAAAPILERAGVPATIFLATGQLGQGREFWWDELARMVLGRRAGANGSLRLDECLIAVHLPPLEFDASVSTNWRAWQPPTTQRQRLYLELWRSLRGLGNAARADAMHGLRRIFDQDAPDPASLPMTQDDVRRIAMRPGIEIGAHSRTHQPLTLLLEDERRQEIEGSRAECERLAGHPVRGFAYPYGDRDADIIRMVRDLGFDWACSTRDAAIDPAQFDRFDLPRRQVLDWDVAEFGRELDSMRRAA